MTVITTPLALDVCYDLLHCNLYQTSHEDSETLVSKILTSILEFELITKYTYTIDRTLCAYYNPLE